MPSRVLLEPKIEVQHGAEGHWFWRGGFNHCGEPVFRWEPPTGRASICVVARLLVHHDVAPIPKGASVRSQCGVIACINPAHWMVETLEERAAKRRGFKVYGQVL